MPLFGLGALVSAMGVVMKWVIATAIGLFVLRLVVVLGAALVTYVGIQFALGWFEDFITLNLPAAGPVASIFGLMGLDVGLSILFSAWGIVIGLKTFNGSISRLTFVGGS